MSNTSPAESSVRSTNNSPPANSGVYFDPERIFLIAGHGSETRLELTKNSKYFKTTIANGKTVEYEFPRLKVPPNFFVANTAVQGVAQAYGISLIESFELLADERKVHVPSINAGYTQYKRQIQTLGNELVDETWGKIKEKINSAGSDLFSITDYYKLQNASAVNYETVFEPILYFKKFRFRSYGNIPNPSNIQTEDDTFYFYSPNVSTKIFTSSTTQFPSQFEENIVILERLMISGVIPVTKLAERFPFVKDDAALKDKIAKYAFFFIGDLIRNYTLSELQNNLPQYVAACPQDLKNELQAVLKAKKPYQQIYPSSEDSFQRIIATEDGGANDVDIIEFLRGQIELINDIYNWGVFYTNDEFMSKRLKELYNTRTDTKSIIDKITAQIGTDRPALVIAYHCRSFLVKGESLEKEILKTNRGITYVQKSTALTPKKKSNIIARLKEKRYSLNKKQGSRYQNELAENARGRGIHISQKLKRLQEEPTTNAEGQVNRSPNTRIRFGPTFGIKRSLSVAANPLYRNVAPENNFPAVNSAPSDSAGGGRRKTYRKKLNRRRHNQRGTQRKR